MCYRFYFFFFKQKTAYEMRISDWSSDVCSSDLEAPQSTRNPYPERIRQTDRPRVDGLLHHERTGRAGTGNPLLRSSHRSGSTGQPIPPAAGCRAPGQGQAGPCRKDRVAWLDTTPCCRLGSRWSQVTQTPYDPCSPTGRSFDMHITQINGKRAL